MKDSGLPWAGQIPSHWDLEPNRSVLRKRKVLVGATHSAFRLLSLTKNGIIVRDVESGKGKFSADMGTSQEVRPGDFVFCLFDIPETPRTVGLSSHFGMITGAYTVFECLDPNRARFLELFYIAMDDRKLLSPLYMGLRNTIAASRFLGIKSPLPPPEEQTAIVRYLDHMDKRIRKAILAKQKLIKLLEEQKRAIIHNAVTRGLDPRVGLKPSGVEWLGMVPEGWEVRKITTFAKVGNGSTPSRANPSYWRGGEYPWLNSGAVKNGNVTGSSQFVSELALKECHLPKVPPGSVLVAITGQGKTRGTSAVLHVEATINQHIAYISNRTGQPRVVPEFLQQTLSEAYRELRRISDDSGSTKGALTCQALKHFKVPVPPIQEQYSIVEAIHLETAGLNETLKRVTKEVLLLQEYRTRLIVDVVTGKVDVRKVAAGLPDEVTEPTPEEAELDDDDSDELEDEEPTEDEA